jgi:predicted RNA methylase
MDVKNTLEVIAAVELLGVAGKQIAKDGIAIDDLPKALELLKKYDVLVAAVEGISDVVDEAKDIDSAEAVVIVTALMATIKKIKES